MQVRGGRVVRAGAGLSMVYYGPTSSLVNVSPELLQALLPRTDQGEAGDGRKR